VEECGTAPYTADDVPVDAPPGSESKRVPSDGAGGNAKPDASSNGLKSWSALPRARATRLSPRDLGRSEPSVRESFLRAMESTATVTDEARLLALMRLDRLLYQWWDDATGDLDDRKAFIRAHRAMRQVIRILDQQLRVQGLYKC
jgi:hypothetical protein